MFRKRRKLKIVLIVLAVIAVAALTTLLIITQHYKGIVKKELPKWVADGTDGLYKLSLKSIGVNIFTNQITFKKVNITPDTSVINQLPANDPKRRVLVSLYIPKLYINGTDIEAYLNSKRLNCSSLQIEQPTIIIDHKSACNDDASSKKKAHLRSVKFNRIILNDANITYKNTSKEKSTLVNASNVSTTLYDWEFIPSAPYDSSKIFYADRATVETGAVKLLTDSLLYQVAFEKADYDTKQERITIHGFTILPKYDNEEFYTHVGHQCDIYNLNLQSIEFAQFSWQKLIYDNAFISDNVYINNSSLHIFHSRIPPEDPHDKLGKFPHQILQKSPLPIGIKQLKIKNGTVGYSELNKKTNKVGDIEFSSLEGEINNITNIPKQLDSNNSCEMNIKAKFNTYSDLNAVFNLDLTDEKGGFSVKGKLTDLEAHQVTEQSKALTRLEINSLRLQYLDIDIEGNEQYAKGKFTMAYKGLKIKIPRAVPKKGSENDGMLSFIANNVFIYTHNPMPGKEIRHVSTYVKRDKYKSFFNLIWKNIFQAATKTAIRDPNILEMLNKPKKEKEEKKQKGRFKNLFKKKNREQ
ncbi:MAG: hypothetical protein R2800_06385 [Flavipsychrobacter sp.]